MNEIADVDVDEGENGDVDVDVRNRDDDAYENDCANSHQSDAAQQRPKKASHSH